MKIGFTGTQKGMSKKQMIALHAILSYLAKYGSIEFHHGDCIGADHEAHVIATLVGAKIVVHPPTNSSKRAFCKADVIMPERDYLVRNHNIVDSVDHMIATPNTVNEVLRSGTWATIRYSRKSKVKVTIIEP